jgi:hypothetical protein
MERKIDGEKVVLKIVGPVTEAPFRMASSTTKFHMELTHVEELKIGEHYRVRYYEADMIATYVFDEKVQIRFYIRFNPAFFRLWHKGTGPSKRIKDFVIDVYNEAKQQQK